MNPANLGAPGRHDFERVRLAYCDGIAIAAVRADTLTPLALAYPIKRWPEKVKEARRWLRRRTTRQRNWYEETRRLDPEAGRAIEYGPPSDPPDGCSLSAWAASVLARASIREAWSPLGYRPRSWSEEPGHIPPVRRVDPEAEPVRHPPYEPLRVRSARPQGRPGLSLGMRPWFVVRDGGHVWTVDKGRQIAARPGAL